MAAKLLHSLADDNPDLQKQIGCMTGIFQLFDRQHVLTGRRLSHRRLPPANSHFNTNGFEGEPNNAYNQQSATGMNLSRSVNEKQRISVESSRPSFSTSCSSSLSSLEFNKTTQPEAASFDRIIFPETPPRDPVMNQASVSPHLGQQSLDLRDVVRDSMYREARGLSVKTTSREEVLSRSVKHRDSPRPLQLSKSVDGSYGISGKQDVPVDLKESLRVLTKLREAPRHYNEAKELPRSSYEAKDGSWNSISKDAPRFSYDGRETNRLSFDSRDMKCMPKRKELPRLSLDSREGSVWGSNSDLRTNYISKSFLNSVNSAKKVPSESSESQKRPPGIVAKLMGLETLPESASGSESQSGLMKNGSVEDGNLFSRSLRGNDLNRPIRTSSKSPRSSLKDPKSPRWKNPDLIMKPLSTSRFPIEPAPWRQLDGSRRSQKTAFRPVKVPTPTPNSTLPSIYSEIENRLKDLEFKQSGKDLRALKQILEAMQAKGFLDTKKEEQSSNFRTHRDCEPKGMIPNQSPEGQRNRLSNHVVASAIRDSDSLRTFESPIVIMKPAKHLDKAGSPVSSAVPIHSSSSLHKSSSHGAVDSKRSSINGKTVKDRSPRNSQGDFSTSSTDKKTSSRSNRSKQTSTRPQQLSKESTGTSVKSSGSISPRLQQRKLEFDKRSRPPTPPSDSGKSRRQSNRQPRESSSPGGKLRLKSPNLQRSDDQLSQISNESRSSSYQGDDISVHSDSSVVLDPKQDVEITSVEQSVDIHDNQSPSVDAFKHSVSGAMQKESSPRLNDDGSPAKLATVAPEHRSPISVLDMSMYREDETSPVKQIPNNQGDGCAQDYTDNPADNFVGSMGSGLTSEINRKKLQNIEHLVQKLRRVNSSHDEARTDYIASLCENTNPDHRYISEILLASGLLLRDLDSGLATFQLHPSGNPINPELFFVLEQTKASTLPSKEECNLEKVSKAKSDHEKFHRKLIFDAVNEILVEKLASVGPSTEPWLKSDKLAKKTLNAQKLLKELCSEIDQYQANRSVYSLEDEEDGLKGILSEDVMHFSGSWTDFHFELSGVVLDVERMVFKDLVNEIVIGEAAGSRTKPGRRRQLFFEAVAV